MTGCRKIGSGFGTLHMYNRYGQVEQNSALTYTEMVDIEFIEYGNGTSTYRYQYIDDDGVLQDVTRTWSERYSDTKPYANGKPFSDSTCAEQAEDTPVDWQPNTPIGPTYEYTDPETGCNWQIRPMDVYLDSKGEPVFHWKATNDDPVNCGDPYEWWGNGQEPNIPNFPDPGGPYGRPKPPTLPPGPGQNLDERFDKIEELLEQLRECACPEKPELARHWRSIRFDSEENTPRGNRRLSKLFRYRGVSPGVVQSVADHWKDFRWRTGATCVYHKGSALGTPQVWAASVDEGKRVIRHAGGEAGIDPDQIGKWGISSSNNSRYGVSGQMKVDTTGGYYWITARDGEDGRPIVART